MRYDEMPGASVVVFRKPSLTTFAVLGMLVLTIGVIAGALKPHDHGVMFGAVPLSLIVYILWLVASSGVRIDSRGITVHNLLMRHVVPWHELAEITAANGLIIRLRDETEIGSIMYGGSLLGALFGTPFTHRACARMNAKRREILAAATPGEGGTYRRSIHFSPWPPLVILVVLEALASLSLLR